MEEDFLQSAIISLAQGNNLSAIEQLSKIISKNDKDYEAYLYRSIAYCNKGDYTNSLADLEAAEKLRKEDEDDEFYYFKGKTFFYNQELDKAKENFAKGLNKKTLTEEMKQKIEKYLEKLN